MSKPFAYFGTPYVASDTLAYLLEHGYRPSVVITSPDAPRGRGLVLTPSETKVLALEHNIPVLTPEKITDEVVAEITSYGCEYGIVVAYGKILPETLIQAFPRGLINVHYSLLPKYRGASPVESALRNGDTVTGVAIQQLVYQLDAGDILASVEVPIDAHETTRELRPRLVATGAELLISLLPSFEDGTATRTPQDHTQATRCGKILKSEGELNLEDDAQKNWNTYRALAESPGTYFFADRHGKRVRVKILTAHFSGSVFAPDRVIPEGKQEMSYQDFMR
ncbi:MAG: methionyl-tRNA formyltransferase [Patescibacteria group bacterium]